MNESRTRKEFIDPALKKRGWAVGNPAQVIEEFEMEKRLAGDRVAAPGAVYDTGREYADYLLLGRDGSTPLAVVEAKRSSKDPREGQKQASGYADNILKATGQEPFIFLANGEDIWFWDRLRYPPRLVQGFFEQTDFERLLYQRKEREPKPSQLPIRSDIVDRDYQFEAITQVLEGLEQGKRKFLVVMATGTGKTRTVMALIDALIRAKWIQNVLFLADRKVLREQAYGVKGFQGYFTESAGRITSGRFEKEKRLYAATIQTMMECYRDISPGFFDLIVADECHRSIYNKWKDVLSYFDAIQVGLTATPANIVGRDTLRYFDCLDGKPTASYDYETAVNEKWLVPFVPIHAKTSFQVKGLKEGDIPPSIKKKLVEEGNTLEELDFEGTEFERRFTNTGTHEAMIREFMERCIKDPSGTLPGKSIFFAMTKNHAYRLLAAFDKLYPEYKGRLAEVIVSQDSRADTFVERFENESFPRVAISVDMLETGVDVREVVNLVFARPVFSKIRFWQMLGRGTRTLERSKIKAWCEQKHNFLVFDHWNNFEYFKIKPEGETPELEEALPTRVFKGRVERLKFTIDNESPSEAESIGRLLKAMIEALPRDSVSVKEKRDVLARVEAKGFWDNVDSEFLLRDVAPILRFIPDINYNEYSFILKCERMALALLTRDAGKAESLAEKIREDVRALPLTLSVVKKKQDAILQAASDKFWGAPLAADIDALRDALAPLMKFKKKEAARIIEFDLDDEIVERKWIVFGPLGEGAYLQEYREKVEKHVRDLADRNPALNKIKNDLAVSDEDLSRLEDALNAPDLYINESNLREVYAETDGTFAQFIRKILGKFEFPRREEKIAESFEAFVIEKNYMNSNQLRFLRIVKNVFLEKARRGGKLTLADLYEGPFEALGMGVADRLFKKEELAEILDFFNQHTRGEQAA